MILLIYFQTKQADVFINAYLLSDLLYESEYEGQMWMLYDSNKMLLGVGDAFSDRVSFSYIFLSWVCSQSAVYTFSC